MSRTSPCHRRTFHLVFPVFIGALATVLLGGCTASSTDAAADRPPTFSSDRYREAFETGVQVLRDAGFQVNRQDFRFGRINTHPQGSPTVFEPWKPDNARADEAWLSTLGDLRRVVTVSLEPEAAPTAAEAPPTGYLLRVEVVLERLQVPERRLNGQTQGSVFADLAEAPAELRPRGVTQRYWQPIGRDLALEQALTEKILSRMRALPG